MQTKATINDVARIAGVSKRTVSRVINGSPSVGKVTREKIEQVIKDVNFQPDKQARGLASKRSYLLGLIYDNPDALYIDQVQRGVLEICSSLGYELVVHPCHWKQDNFIEDCLNFINRSRVDGVIIIPPVSESSLLADALRNEEVPYVRIASTDLEDSENIVISNDKEAMAELANHVTDLGHKDIAFITGPMEYYSSKERLSGISDTLKTKGIELTADNIIEGTNRYESGIECGKQLLTRENRPSVICTNNDQMACGVIRAANDLGLKVPEDISVTGFDDNIIASRIIPSLTTMRRPVEKIAKLATQKLVHGISQESKSTKDKIVVTPYLITRESTAKCES